MSDPGPERLPADRARAEVRKALAAAGAPIPLDAEALTEAPRDLVRSLPGWIRRFGFLEGLGTFILWCKPRSDAERLFPSQVILDVPPGRYFVETLDAGTGRWISRESAEGGPLVAGLPQTGSPVLVLVRPCAGRL